MQKRIRTEIEIDAGAERIFGILTDLARYPEWNPFTPRVRSTLREGDWVWLFLATGKLPGSSHPLLVPWPEKVRSFEPNRRLRWGLVFGRPEIFEAERIQTLEPIGARRTRYVSEDRMTGRMAPLILRLFGGAVQRGFDEVAWALKKRAESDAALGEDRSAGAKCEAREGPPTSPMAARKEEDDG